MAIELTRRLFFSAWPKFRTEILRLDGDRLSFHGIERRFVLWSWSRAQKEVFVGDIQGFHTRYVTHPLIWLMAAVCLMNIVGNLSDLRWWFALDFWKVPYLWVFAPAAQILAELIARWTDLPPQQCWAAVHALVLLFYVGLAFFMRRRLMGFDVGLKSSIVFNASKINASTLAQFREAFESAWHAAKHSKH